MSVAYLIASHTNPSQVARLVRRIRAERPVAPIVVHHDRLQSRLSADTFPDDEHIFFVEPSIAGEWGSYALVQLALNGLETLWSSGEEFRWVTFISGQDYPARSLREFEAALPATGDGAIERGDERPQSVMRYRLGFYRLPERLETRNMHRLFFVLGILAKLFDRKQRFVAFTTGRVGCRFGIVHPKSPVAGLRIYKGYQWWTLSRAAVAYVRDYIERNPDFVAWFATRVLIPDEAFFQTILMTSDMKFAKDDGRYVKWRHADAMSPEILTIDDLPDILRSERFFARKFYDRVDARVLDELDRGSLGHELRL